MKRIIVQFATLLIVLCQIALAQQENKAGKSLKIALIKNPYAGDRASPETQEGPDILAKSGIVEQLPQLGVEAKALPTIKLMPKEEN